jgi:hypothetical protein
VFSNRSSKNKTLKSGGFGQIGTGRIGFGGFLPIPDGAHVVVLLYFFNF